MRKRHYKRSLKKDGKTLIIAIALTTIMSILNACSSPEKINSTSDSVINESTSVEVESLSTESAAVSSSMETEAVLPYAETENTSVESIDKSVPQALSEDAEQLQEIAKLFADAYFSGDTETIKKYLTTPYEWDIEVYSNSENTPDVSTLTINGLSGIDNKNVEDVCVLSLQYKSPVADDMLEHLTLEFVKQSDGWKIQFYGIE